MSYDTEAQAAAHRAYVSADLARRRREQWAAIELYVQACADTSWWTVAQDAQVIAQSADVISAIDAIHADRKRMPNEWPEDR